MPKFIALDGEGITREDNQHDYVLLASSSNQSIHNLSRDGLSTAACFDFILDEAERNKGAILVGFYTNYDVNMILRDLSKTDLARLRVEGMVTWRDEIGHKCYRIKYLPNRLLTVSEGYWKDFDKPKRKWRGIRSAKWWDCSRFFQSSFVAALRSWKIGIAEIEQIESMKLRRNVFTESDMPQITQYCYNECRLLVNLMDKLAALLSDCGISITSWYGAGSVATALMRQHKVTDFLEITENVEPNILASYYGGRIETFGVGYVSNPSYQYDIRSAYPSAVLSLPSMAGGKWKLYTGNRRAKYAIKHVKWRATDKKKFFTPFPYRSDGHIYWPETGEGWYHAIEVDAAIEHSGYQIEVLETWKFTPQSNENPFDWIREVYALRQYYREQKDEREKVLKYPLNSIYGKFAQGNNGKWDPPFQNYYYAGYITAWCRAQIIRAMSYFNDGEVLTVATDGIITTRKDSRIEVGEALGQFECKDVEPGLLVIQAGVYATPTEITRTRGFSSRAVIYSELVKLWKDRKIDAKFEVRETKFIGYGLALNMKTMAHWRRWLPAVKTIRFGGNGTKAPHYEDLINNDWIRLLPPTKIDAPNEPYDPSAPALLALKQLFEGIAEGDDWDNGEDWRLQI